MISSKRKHPTPPHSPSFWFDWPRKGRDRGKAGGMFLLPPHLRARVEIDTYNIVSCHETYNYIHILLQTPFRKYFKGERVETSSRKVKWKKNFMCGREKKGAERKTTPPQLTHVTTKPNQTSPPPHPSIPLPNLESFCPQPASNNNYYHWASMAPFHLLGPHPSLPQHKIIINLRHPRITRLRFSLPKNIMMTSSSSAASQQ